MKNLIYVLMAFMLATTACNETEVPVEEVTTDVKFSVKTENVTLKSASKTVEYDIDKIRITCDRNGNQTHDKEFDLPDEQVILQKVQLGINTFKAKNVLLSEWNIAQTDQTWKMFPIADADYSCEQLVEKMRDIPAYLQYQAKEDIVIKASDNDVHEMNMMTNNGRLIVTFEFADKPEYANYSANVSIKTSNGGSYTARCGKTPSPANLCKKGFFYWSSPETIQDEKVHLQIFINDGNKMIKMIPSFTDEKLTINSAVDRWVNVIIGTEANPLVKDKAFNFVATYDVENEIIKR